jgi:hypothetical protein
MKLLETGSTRIEVVAHIMPLMLRRTSATTKIIGTRTHMQAITTMLMVFDLLYISVIYYDQHNMSCICLVIVLSCLLVVSCRVVSCLAVV